MDKKEPYIEVKEMLETIKNMTESLIGVYNEMDVNEKLQLDYVKPLEKEDVSKKYICVYNDNQTGLFERNFYDDANAMIYFNSNHTGIQLMKNGWIKKGSFIELYYFPGKCGKIRRFATCDMTEAIHFDDLRLIMYSAGIIDTFEIGKATEQEILEVLKYARTYYHLDNVQKHR